MTLPAPFAYATTYPGHSGVDYPRPRGSRFYASGPGIVRRLSTNAAGGNWITIKYDEIPYEVGYAHMDSHRGCPPVGTRVREGTFLGFVGATGTRVTGPHIHLEILTVGTDTAVWKYFSRDRYVNGGKEVTYTAPGIAYQQRFHNEWRGKKLKVDNKFGTATKAENKAYQTHLKDKGYYSGAIDGVWGAGTESGHVADMNDVKQRIGFRRTTTYIKALKALEKAGK